MKKKKEIPSDRLQSSPSLLPVCLLILSFFAQAAWHAKVKSATYDEGAHLTTSLLIAKTGNLNYNIDHPPLIRYLFAVPLRWLNPSLPEQMEPPLLPPTALLSELPGNALYFYSTALVYGNRVPADTMIFWTRMVNILLGCLLAFLVFLWSSEIYGRNAGLWSLALLSFCPNFIAHSSLITTDAGGVTFGVAALYFFSRLLRKENPTAIALTGISLGLALLSKWTNIILPPLFFVLYAWSRGRNHVLGSLKNSFLFLSIAWLILCIGYKFENIFIPHLLRPEDWTNLGVGKIPQIIYQHLPLPESFLKGIACSIWHNKRGHGAFFMGSYSSFGWRSYFPTAFLIKTPSVTLIACAALLVQSLASSFKNVKHFFSAFGSNLRNCNPSGEAVILSGLLLLLWTALNSKINIGLRHILLAYPLLYVLAGKLAAHPLWTAKKTLRISLMLLLPVEVLSASPHYLAFFNRLAGGPEKGIRYLSDSNIDWGQDLKGLAQFLKEEGNPEILLSYFGTAVPEYYGIRYQPLPTLWAYPKSEHLNSEAPAKEFLAVSVSNLQGTYFSRHDLYGWLLKKEPVRKIGYSIYVYDVTSDLESQKEILEMCRMTGDVNGFMRQVKRINRLRIKQAE